MKREMLSVSKQVGGYIEGYVVSHMIDHIISWDWYQKGVQTTFLKELIIIFKRRQSHIKIIEIKLQKVKDFSLSQNVGLVCR